jgi:hypothetical protein
VPALREAMYFHCGTSERRFPLSGRQSVRRPRSPRRPPSPPPWLFPGRAARRGWSGRWREYSACGSPQCAAPCAAGGARAGWRAGSSGAGKSVQGRRNREGVGLVLRRGGVTRGARGADGPRGGPRGGRAACGRWRARSRGGVRRAACAGTELGEGGGVAFAEALQVNGTLTTLNLSRAWPLPSPRVHRHPRLSVAVPWPCRALQLVAAVALVQPV